MVCFVLRSSSGLIESESVWYNRRIEEQTGVLHMIQLACFCWILVILRDRMWAIVTALTFRRLRQGTLDYSRLTYVMFSYYRDGSLALSASTPWIVSSQSQIKQRLKNI